MDRQLACHVLYTASFVLVRLCCCASSSSHTFLQIPFSTKFSHLLVPNAGWGFAIGKSHTQATTPTCSLSFLSIFPIGFCLVESLHVVFVNLL